MQIVPTKSFLFVRKIRKWVFDVGLSTSTFLAFANEAAWRNLDTFYDQKNYFSFTKRYFQGNSDALRTEIIQK